MRHFFALLTSLSMLHLMLVGGDLACASHGQHDGNVMPGMVMASTSHHAGRDGRVTAQPAQDCTAPTQTRCCAAMSSCSVTTTVSATERTIAQVAPHTGAPAHVSRVLVSVLTAPEPPPPKA